MQRGDPPPGFRSTLHRRPGHRASIVAGEATGNLVFDAQIAALCREHGVDRLLSEDRDFRRFPTLSLVTLDISPGVH
jgi:predicted nucleic acid-binding protein